MSLFLKKSTENIMIKKKNTILAIFKPKIVSTLLSNNGIINQLRDVKDDAKRMFATLFFIFFIVLPCSNPTSDFLFFL